MAIITNYDHHMHAVFGFLEWRVVIAFPYMSAQIIKFSVWIRVTNDQFIFSSIYALIRKMPAQWQ